MGAFKCIVLSFFGFIFDDMLFQKKPNRKIFTSNFAIGCSSLKPFEGGFCSLSSSLSSSDPH